MRERPILFSGPMVRAILAGTKTQTRRALKVQPPASTVTIDLWHHPDPRPHFWACDGGSLLDWAYPCPYGQPGDRLWVRETWNRFEPWSGFHYAADYEAFGIGPDDDPDHIPDHEVRWRPSIHMPRAACRIVLEITRVRVERLQDISADDAWAEGVQDWMGVETPWKGVLAPTEVHAFASLWESVNGAGSWAANPWVWVVEFRRVAQ